MIKARQIAALGISALLCLSAQIVVAADRYKATAYVGGALSLTQDNKDGLEDIANQFGATRDDKDTALQVFGGYRFNKYFAIEGKLANLGEYTISDCCDNIRIKGRAASVDAALIIPFGNAPLDLQAQIGLAVASVDVTSNFSTDEDSSKTGGHAGLALRWHASDAVIARVGVESWVFDSNESTDLTVTAISIGAQYNFK